MNEKKKEIISVMLPNKFIDILDLLCDNGFFISRSAAARHAIDKLLRKEFLFSDNLDTLLSKGLPKLIQVKEESVGAS
ncbi:MAG: hypothetical protein GF353_28670 [Candidatus Lokiarchaeota archaeon]|nr:hypothetical protein [Candidatus Lokiarchaeota archaeon]MBD3353976.1 hypothetical protein [Candidatus Lokiarchaeota archaeon]